MNFTCGNYDGNGGDWDAYVKAHTSATNYHLWGWRTVVVNSFGHPCYYLSACDQKGKLVGILPLVHMQSRLFGSFLISVPFFNYGGLLCDRQDIGDALLAEAALLRKELGAEHVELRHVEPWPGDLPTKRHKVSMLLELAEDAEAQWKCFNAKLRNQIRKAEKSGLTAAVGGRTLRRPHGPSR